MEELENAEPQNEGVQNAEQSSEDAALLSETADVSSTVTESENTAEHGAEEAQTTDESTEKKAESKRASKKAVKETAVSMGRTLLGYIDRGVEASKKGFRSAGNAISDFGDKSVLRIELGQLKTKKARSLNELGAYVYKALLEERPVSLEDEELSKLFTTIQTFDKDIAAHEKSLEEKGNS